MANPKEVMLSAIKKEGNSCMCELVMRAFTTRNLLQFAHWSTDSYAKHEALGEMYDSIVSKLDEIVEVYQGRFGLLNGLSAPAAAVPSNILAHVEEESRWLGMNKSSIASGCEAVVALLDELEACYLKSIYKLSNLR